MFLSHLFISWYTFQDTNKSKKTFLTIYYPNVKNDCIDKFNLSTIQWDLFKKKKEYTFKCILDIQ